MRDDFSRESKEILAKRVGYRCSNPNCRKLTSGPKEDPTKAINIGVAAHITAASAGGPRFDSMLTPEQRKSPENGIWLCQNCAKLIDSDEKRYNVLLIKKWKNLSEQAALLDVENNALFNERTFVIQEVAGIFASRLEQHWAYLTHLQQLFIGFLYEPYKLKTELKAKALEFSLQQIKQDEIYKNARIKIGVLPRKVLDYLSAYDQNFTLVLNSLDRGVANPLSLENDSTIQMFLNQVFYTRLDCSLVLALLNEEILKDAERFLHWKDYLKSEYQRAREALHDGEKLPPVIFSTLEEVEKFFKDLGMIDEISPLLIRPEVT